MRAIRCVVAYPPEGGHSTEKLMRYGDLREVSGLLVPGTLHTSAWDAEAQAPGDVVTRIDVRDVPSGRAGTRARAAPRAP